MTTPRFDKDPDAWWQAANCAGVDPELFFPARGVSLPEARRVCGGCSIQRPCAQYALTNGEKFGVWGGLSERQRRSIRYGHSTLTSELAAARGRRCVECSETFYIDALAANRKTCGDICASRRGVRLARERLAGARRSA